MKELNNPFVVYGYKGAPYFCDREKETSNIAVFYQQKQSKPVPVINYLC